MASTTYCVKRKHIILNTSEKWEIIKQINRGKTLTAVAKVYEIGRPTLYNIIKTEKFEGLNRHCLHKIA